MSKKYLEIPDNYEEKIESFIESLGDSKVKIINEEDIFSLIIDERINNIFNRIITINEKDNYIDEDLIPAYKKLIMRRTDNRENFIKFDILEEIIYQSIMDVNDLINGDNDYDFDEE